MTVKQPIKIGEVFGKLTVLNKSVKTDKGFNAYYDCKCDCGGFKTTRGTNLRFGKTMSCGCLHSAMTGAINRKQPGVVSWTNFRTTYKSGAKVRDYAFELTEEEFKSIAEKDCHYCGEPPKLMNYYLKADNISKKSGKSRKVTQQQIDASWINANGIDRVDSSVGYIKSNCVPCCSRCNLFKNDLKVSDFLEHVSKIVKFQNLQENIHGNEIL